MRREAGKFIGQHSMVALQFYGYLVFWKGRKDTVSCSFSLLRGSQLDFVAA